MHPVGLLIQLMTVHGQHNIKYQNIILHRQLELAAVSHSCCRKRHLIVERRIIREEVRWEIWGSPVDSLTIQVVRDVTSCHHGSSFRRFGRSYYFQFLVKVDSDWLTLKTRAHLFLEKVKTNRALQSKWLLSSAVSMQVESAAYTEKKNCA